MKIAASAGVGAALLAAIALAASRVGETARFMTWPVVAFTALAAAVALLGLWTGLDRPGMLAAGVLPALAIAYVLPAAPMPAVAVVLAGLAALAVGVRGIASGMALAVGLAFVLITVAQGPVVECSTSSVSTNSGPWWIVSPSSSSGSGGGGPGDTFSGTTQVGNDHYAFTCEDGGLARFERTDAPR
ncbi:MAG TPA: hypothetical protein VM938_15010 [Acidimicrobiales bacterium]|nr:hypothetical protein [Acidimicrobiales bacterium]